MGLYINGIKMGKPYINGVKHNAFINGQKMWSNGFGKNTFAFQVEDNGSFGVPVSGLNSDSLVYQAYNWKINWGDGNIEPVSGTGARNKIINHTYIDGKNTHIIIIEPATTASQGWFNAFGTGDLASATNSAKIKKLFTPLTGFMRTISASYACYYMFHNCSGLTSLPNKFLPATILANGCYEYMFQGCTGLTAIPENLLPATILTEYCYMSMFQGCTGLTAIPENLLPATTMVGNCYSQMFDTCIELISIGTIDANWFTGKAAQSKMFMGCTKIATPITYASIPSGWK
jgi:hypothetical protein